MQSPSFRDVLDARPRVYAGPPAIAAPCTIRCSPSGRDATRGSSTRTTSRPARSRSAAASISSRSSPRTSGAAASSARARESWPVDRVGVRTRGRAVPHFFAGGEQSRQERGDARLRRRGDRARPRFRRGARARRGTGGTRRMAVRAFRQRAAADRRRRDLCARDLRARDRSRLSVRSRRRRQRRRWLLHRADRGWPPHEDHRRAGDRARTRSRGRGAAPSASPRIASTHLPKGSPRA